MSGTDPLLPASPGPPWSMEQTAELGNDSGDTSFLMKAPLLRGEGTNITSVTEAIEKLNSGAIVAENGICICYSRDKNTYYALWKADSRDIAKAVFNLLEPTEGGEMKAPNTTGFQFQNRHATFAGHLRLSLTVALWATVFGLPMYSPVHDTIFGDPRHLSDLRDQHGNALVPGDELACQGDDIFGMVYDSTTNLSTNPNHMVPWVEDEHGPWVDSGYHTNTSYPQVWCGYLPQGYAGNWPNVIQMIVFTAYFTTGSTVQLAWQGIIGTFLATANAAIMGIIFHTGALSDFDESDPDNPVWLNYKDPHYKAWIGYANFAIVTFLFLACKAEANTIKFGLSWHATYMMSFVNPSVGQAPGLMPIRLFGAALPAQWDSYRTIVLLTSIAGATLAILATLFPFRLLNMAMINQDGDTIVSAIDSIWKSSIEYFCGDKPTGKNKQIAATIDSLQDTISSVNSHLSTAWWECFNIGKSGRRHLFFKMFDDKVGNLNTRNLLYAVKDCIINEEFDESHITFCQKLQKRMDDLRAETAGLLHILIGVCREGECDDKMVKLINWKVDLVKDAQKKLHSAYETAGPDGGPPGVDKTWAHEYTFIFALSHWASAITKFAQKIQDPNQRPQKSSFIAMCRDQVRKTFDRKEMFAAGHLNFILRNTTSIVVAFFLGIYLHQWGFPMYRPYTATMASTLCLLMSKFGGSAMENNLKRLLGVVLGKVIPIVILGMLSYFECDNDTPSDTRFFAQIIAVYVFMFAFSYVYYTSVNWGSVGCLIAGFGCYPLIAYPSCDNSGAAGTYTSNYEELCEIVTCILIQMFVDEVGEKFYKTARVQALDHLKLATEKCDECVEQFFSGSDAIDLKATRTAASAALDKAAAKLPDVDSSKLVYQGPDTPFNLSLYEQCLSTLRLLLSDLNMIIIAIHEVKENNKDDENLQSEIHMKTILKDLTKWTQKADGQAYTFQEDTQRHISNCSKALLAILSKTEEVPLENSRVQFTWREEDIDIKYVAGIFKEFEQTRLGRGVLGRTEMFEDCGALALKGSQLSANEEGGSFSPAAVKDVFAVRISVIIIACNNIVKHMGQLSALCVEGNIH